MTPRTLSPSSNERRLLSLSSVLGEQQETFPPWHWPSDWMIECLLGLAEPALGGIAATARAKEMTEMIEAFIVEDLGIRNDR